MGGNVAHTAVMDAFSLPSSSITPSMRSQWTTSPLRKSTTCKAQRASLLASFNLSSRARPDVAEAHRMIRETRGFAVLDGARGLGPADVEALAQAISQLSQFAAANRERLAGVDINPFVVRARGQGALGLDAVIELKDRRPG